jgi:hypothetical protein
MFFFMMLCSLVKLEACLKHLNASHISYLSCGAMALQNPGRKVVAGVAFKFRIMRGINAPQPEISCLASSNKKL